MTSAEQDHQGNAQGLVKLLGSTELIDGLWSVLHEEWFDEAEDRPVVPEAVLENWNRLSMYMSFGTAASASSPSQLSSRSTSIERLADRRKRRRGRTVPSVDVWRKIKELRQTDFMVDSIMEDLYHLSQGELLDGHHSHIPILDLRGAKRWSELPKYMGRLKAQNVANDVRLVVVRLAIHNAVARFARTGLDVDSNQAPHLTKDQWVDFVAKHWHCRVDDLPDDGAEIVGWIRSESKIAFRYHLVVTQVQPVGYAILVHLVASRLVMDNQFQKELALTKEIGQKGLQYLRSLDLGDIAEVNAWSKVTEAWYDEMCLVLRP